MSLEVTRWGPLIKAGSSQPKLGVVSSEAKELKKKFPFAAAHGVNWVSLARGKIKRERKLWRESWREGGGLLKSPRRFGVYTSVPPATSLT
jgi:hypothetical protein